MDFYRRMAEQCRTGTFRKNTGLSCDSTYGAGSFRQHSCFLKKYPKTTVVSTAKGFQFMEQFFPEFFAVQGLPAEQHIVAANDGVLELGQHSLHFVYAPMVHWPEVMMTYEATEKILFAADGFGKFGALDVEEEWANEARRYYIGIVGKYGPQVQAVLKKAAGLDIQTICSLHGPVLKENLGFYLEKYDKWSSYQPEESGVVIAYASVYGNTRNAAEYLADVLRKKDRKQYCMTWQDAIKQKLLPMLSVMTDWCWRVLLIMETSSPACAVLSKV